PSLASWKCHRICGANHSVGLVILDIVSVLSPLFWNLCSLFVIMMSVAGIYLPLRGGNRVPWQVRLDVDRWSCAVAPYTRQQDLMHSKNQGFQYGGADREKAR